MAGMANWQARISIDIDDLKKRIKVAEGELDKIEKKEHKVKLDIDTKTLENAVIKLDRMLESLGKGSGDFKEFENLSKQLSSITTDINNISKAFSVMNDGSDFANSIKSIDTSLTALSNHFVSEMSGRMTSSIKEVKSTLSDIGDGGELAPLLQTINKIENAINELSTSVKGIGFNMNIDVGSNSEMEAKVQSKIANALQAYQRLFDHIKMSSAGGQIITDKFFDFDINQYDTMMGKLQGYKKFIDNMRKEAKAQFNGQDVLYQDTEKSFWTQASSAAGQVTKVFNEMKAASSTNPLADMFSKTDLSEVISQLGLIVAKLEEISTTASSFKNAFANGFNVTASVKEIDKLTNRVKELEDELSKVKLNTSSVDKSNISSGTQIKDVFQGGTTSAEKLEEEIKNIGSATEKASESAKEYKKILSQVGEFDIDSKVSAMYKRNDGQLESWTWRAKTNDEGKVLRDQDGRIEGYGDPTITVISKYEQLEKIIVKADNELRNLQKDLAEIKSYDTTASTTNIEAKISDQKEYIRLLEQTIKVISQSDEYLLDEQQIIEARNKAAREYALTTGAKQEKADAKQSASDEKQRLANIEQVNRALNKQQIAIDAIEKTYNKTTNPDLDREVSNQQDLAELTQKKLDIQTKINSLQGKERNSANEKEFLELEKLIAEYKELAKYKLKSNNPSKQELGGQNLQTLIQEQIYKYDKLITKAEKYGDATSETVEKLKEQKDILSKMGSDGKYSATADQYYASRDTYKVESAALSAFEAETKAIEQETKAIERMNNELKSYNDQVPKKPADGKRSDYFEGFVQNYKNAINEAQKYLDNLGDSPVTEEVKKKWKELTDVIEEAKKEMDAVPNADRGSDSLSRRKEIDTITKYLEKFTGISKQAKQELKGLVDQLQSGDPSVNVKKIHDRFLELTAAERMAGRETKSFFDIFKSKVLHRVASQLAMYYLSFYDFIRYTRNAINTVKEFDEGLTKISYTMDMTKKQFDALGESISEMALNTGSSLQNALSVAQIYANMNTTAEEINKLSQPTIILSNLTGFDASTVADDIQAVTQQFNILAEDSMHIVDVYDYISRNIAVDYSKLWSLYWKQYNENKSKSVKTKLFYN